MKIQGLTVWKGLLVTLGMLWACSKENGDGRFSAAQGSQAPILFRADGFPASVQCFTKSGDVSAATLAENGFRVSATTGSSPEREAWTNVAFSLSGGVYKGGKWWPLDNPSYHFYASNASLSFTPDGNTVTVDNTADIVCAYLPAPSFQSLNALRFHHIFACLGDVTVSAVDGYTISGIAMSIVPMVRGTYNLRSGDGFTDGTGWSAIQTGASTAIASEQPGTRANNLYLVPGNYTVSLSWTATTPRGATDHYSASATVSLAAGRRTGISCSLGGMPEVKFGIQLDAFVEEDKVDNPSCLSFYAAEAGTVKWSCSKAALARSIEYSKDFGRSWTSLTSTESGASFSVSAGDIVWVRGDNAAYGDNSGYNAFTFSAATFVYGDISSLLSGDGTSVGDYALRNLFINNDFLQMHPNKPLRLPAISVGRNAYANMFAFCPALTTAPDLPATHLGEKCYQNMFDHCVSLVSVPVRLPANTLSVGCYENMFIHCTSLTYGPVLPALTLKATCYHSMFQNCYSLVSAPELPAQTLVSECYNQMFYSCRSLLRLKALFLTTPGSDYTRNWLNSVGSGGTFIKNSNASWNVRGSSGVPSSWTIETE